MVALSRALGQRLKVLGLCFAPEQCCLEVADRSGIRVALSFRKRRNRVVEARTRATHQPPIHNYAEVNSVSVDKVSDLPGGDDSATCSLKIG